jgi:TonB family protein
MRQFGHTFVVLLMLGMIEASTEAQNHRRRSLPRLTATKSSDVRVDSLTPEDVAKIIEECELPDRPKPKGKIGKIRVLSPCGGRALSLPKPRFPEEAKAAKVSGQVQMDVVIDENGRVVWAKALTGHPLLQDASRKAACRARYAPTRISGQPVKTETGITYNFVTPMQNRFFSQFSLRELVAENKTHAGLICSAGGTGGIAGGGGGGGSRGFSQIKAETFSCQIKAGEGEQFNDEEFIASIKDDVEKAITASGLKITDRGSPEAGSFYFAYRLENIEGRVSISGRKLRDDYYTLKADLEEKAEPR